MLQPPPLDFSFGADAFAGEARRKLLFAFISGHEIDVRTSGKSL